MDGLMRDNPYPFRPEILPHTRHSQRQYDLWFAGLTKSEVLEYAETKMMPTRSMLALWKAARKRLRKG